MKDDFKKNIIIGIISALSFRYLPVYLFNFDPVEYYKSLISGTIISKYKLDLIAILILCIWAFLHPNKHGKYDWQCVFIHSKQSRRNSTLFLC